jgi:GNAT superfamily N-acetyltransferase
MSGIRIETLRGTALLPLLPALAGLRIAVFRDFPYLYEGDEAHEVEYLRSYAASPRAGVVVAFDGDTPVGAATCLPLADETDNVIAPFRARGWDAGRFFYFGESVLLNPWRKRGIGVAFFAAREAHARAVSACDFSTFCGVQRADDHHPGRPADFVPLDGFWRNRGYTRLDLACSMTWREVGADIPTPHTLGFWAKSLTGAKLP